MLKLKLYKRFITIIMVLAVITFISCEKKTEQQQTEGKTEKVSTDTVSARSKPVVEQKITIPEVKGTWSGTFDKRTTTLTITQQSDSSFSGKITINYRQVINQEVTGTFSPTTLKITMADQLHSRYQGKYNGKLSADGKNFSGIFTMDLDGKKFSFNLNKK